LRAASRANQVLFASAAEANLLASNALILEPGRAIVGSANPRVIGELRQRGVDVIPIDFDGPIGFGGGLRSAHHPLLRESALD